MNPLIERKVKRKQPPLVYVFNRERERIQEREGTRER